MKRLFATIRRLAFIASMAALAVLWRDHGAILPSTSRLADWIRPKGDSWAVVDALINFAVILAIAQAIRLAIRWLRFKPPKARSARKINDRRAPSPDTPIQNADEDTLSRKAFAQGIVEVLSSSASEDNTVVAIEGSWGSGKTSVLRMIRGALSNGAQDDPLIIEFDPWPEDSKRGVVSRLLDVIAHTIGTSATLHPGSRAEIERLLLSIADSIATDYGQGHGELFRRVAAWIDPVGMGSRLDLPTSLHANRESVALAMKNLGKRLVVIVDDLDRVDQEELLSILMAVNALSQLPNTNFLLAFDPDVVDAVLESRGMRTGQKSFREKIIQVSVPLPPPAFVELAALFREVLHKYLSARGALNGWQFWHEDTREEAIVICVRLGATPRTLKRLANHTTMLLPRLKREVNAADVLLMELLRAKFSALWDFIRSKRNLLDRLDTVTEGNVLSDIAISMEREAIERTERKAKKHKSLGELALETVREADRTSAKQILLVLFPQLFGKDRTREEREAALRNSRIEIGSNLRKYFSLGVEGMQITDADDRAVIGSPPSREALLSQAKLGGFAEGMLNAIAGHIDPKVAVENSEEFALLILRFSKTVWKTQRQDLSEASGGAIKKLLESSIASDRPKLLSMVVSSDESISTSHEVLLDLFESADLWRDGSVRPRHPGQITYYENQLVPDADLMIAKDQWVRCAWKKGLSAIFEDEPRPTRIVFRMAQFDGPLGDYSRLRDELWDYLAEDKNLARFVSQYSTQSTGMNYSVDGIEKLISHWSEFVRRVKNLDGPTDAVEKIVEYDEVGAGRATA